MNETALTVFSELLPVRPPLLTVGQAVSVAAAVETALSVVNAGRFGYMERIEAICTVASTTAGTWNLRTGMGGTSRLLLQQPALASAPSNRYIWEFPTPWKTDAQGGQFSIQPSVATMGTWIFLVNGFHSSI